MKDRKVILGSIMLLLTIVIVSLNLSFTDNNVDINEDHSSYNLSNILPIEIDSEFLDLPQEEKDSLITVVAILNTRVCPTCVTNTLEFFNEVKKRDEFSDDHHIIFIDEEQDKVKRFTEITRLDHPVKKFNSNEIDPFFHNKSKAFIFLKPSSKVFHYLPIPVAHVSLNSINKEIDTAIELSKINS